MIRGRLGHIIQLLDSNVFNLIVAIKDGDRKQEQGVDINGWPDLPFANKYNFRAN